MTVIVTGGAGFIGSNFVLDWVRRCDEAIINIDKLTYAGNLNNLSSLEGNDQHQFVPMDICDGPEVSRLLDSHNVRAIIHFAAESHVDRSIDDPAEFINTNINGTFRLLEAASTYVSSQNAQRRGAFRFLHVSTDEVFGSLNAEDSAFVESRAYAPNSPYSASKAAADHLVRAYHKTYDLPVVIANCSNNYGPRQFPEKFIPLAILNGIAGKTIPIYGDGKNIRDWLFVGDHCTALRSILAAGKPGETFNVGGNCELTNIDVANSVCDVLDRLRPMQSGEPHASLIHFVEDRPGHDRRYAVDTSKISNSLGWAPQETFASGLEKTVRWYLDNEAWVANVVTGEYQNWIDKNYGERVIVQ